MELVINTYGTRVSIDNGMLLVKSGENKEKLPAKNITGILIEKSCSITSEVVKFAVDNDVDIIFCSKNGKPYARIWGTRFGSISSIRKKQVLVSQSKKGLEILKKMMIQKLTNQIAVLSLLYQPDKATDEYLNNAIAYIEKYKAKLEALEASNVEEVAGQIRGWEGFCSKKYFECINQHLPEQYHFKSRSQHPALDMFNSLLNYAYGMLYGKIESALIRAGIDPFLGLFHRDEYNRPVFVYDVIEVFRYWAEITVINLCMQQVIFPEFFDYEQGGVWLNSDGKHILIQSFNDFLEEIVAMNAIDRSRATHIDLYTKNIAQVIKEF